MREQRPVTDGMVEGGQQVEMVYGPQGTNDALVEPTLADHLREHEREVEADPETLTKERNDRVQRAFRKFHAAHPEVAVKLAELARRYREIGARRGMQYFFEVMRHEHIMRTRDAQGFKLNNDFGPRYARLIERENPDLRGFFAKRQLHGVGLRSDDGAEVFDATEVEWTGVNDGTVYE